MRALISCDWYALPSMSIFQSVPMWRFTDRIVRSGLVIAWRFATSPTRTSPVLENATTDGVVRPPSALGMTAGSPASRVETTELVVPRSMPTALDMGLPPGGWYGWPVRTASVGGKRCLKNLESSVGNFLARGDIPGPIRRHFRPPGAGA